LMKLSTMKKVVDTVDDEWRSPLAEDILERWGYDQGTVYYFRSSANFIFVFKKEGRRYFLRFNDFCERDLETIEAEMDILNYLRNKTLHIALPVKSLNDRYVEVVDTRIGTFYAVVFEGLEGIQYEFEELDDQYFSNWGRTLGQLHHTLKDIPEHYRHNRPSWKDHLTFVGKIVPEQETSAKKELQHVIRWAEDLAVTQETFGLIHYDFELDNLCWKDERVGMLDFDDCSSSWYVADIGYALRDLFEEKIDLEHPQFQKFMEGYSKETTVDMTLLKELSWFMRMHNLVSYAKLLRAVDIPESQDHPEWLIGLREKLLDYIESYRVSFEELGDKYK
jgi:Ser/Thr protein kinase RdoA (MazF antagonist)